MEPMPHRGLTVLANSKLITRLRYRLGNELSLSFKQNLVRIKIQQKQLQLQWIPSHCKIPGNEKADALAKLGSKKKSSSSGVPYHSAKSWIKKKIRQFSESAKRHPD
jgi:hypothetical protein